MFETVYSYKECMLQWYNGRVKITVLHKQIKILK